MFFGEMRRWLNNLSWNTRGRATGRKRGRPARPGLEALEDRAVPAVIHVTSVGEEGVTADATNNDYTRIQQALDAAVNGDTIQLHGTFDWREANAALSWAKGKDGIAGNADDYRALVRPGLNNVTLTAGSLGDATIQGPGDLAGFNQESFLRFSGGDNQNWTISNLRILDFDVSIYMSNGAGGADAFDGTTITNNYIRVAADLNGVEAPADNTQNIGIHYSFGKNQTISNNVIEIPGTGVSDPSADLAGDRTKFSTTVGMQSNTSGSSYDGLKITGNEIRVLDFTADNRERIIGFWDNAHGHLSDIEVSNNKFLNLDDDNDSSLNLQQAFWVTSHSGAATTVTYSGNHVEGANIGFKWMGDPEFPGQNFSAHQAVRLWGNTVVDCNTGVLIQGGGVANLFQNTITGSGDGGAVNVLNGRLIGVEQNDLSGGTGDAIVLGVNSSVTGGIHNNNLATADLGIHYSGTGMVNASGNWWGTSTGPTGLSDQIDYSPWLTTGTDTDLLTAGFQGNFTNLTVNATSPRHAGQTTGNLQEGIDQVLAGGTVNALAGKYVESVTVNKSVTVLGAQAGLNPADRTNQALESIVSAPSGTNGFSIGASNVTVRGFTVTTAGGGVHGIYEATQVTGSVIDRNIVSGFGGLGISLAAGSSGAAVTENDVSGNYAGIYLSTGASNVTVRANVVHDHTGTGFDAGSGIVFEGNNTNVLVSENYIRDNAGSGIYVWHGFGNDFSGTKVTSNSITGNGTGFHITSGTDIDASGNWWGTSTAADVAAQISGPIDVTPFLLTGEDFDLLTVGFQGNDTPVAVPDSASTLEGTPVTIEVLANDSDDEGSPLTPVIVKLPRFGTVVVNADGTFTYTPVFGFTGRDSFTYKVSDGSLDSTAAKVNVTVDPLPSGVSIRGSELFVSGSENFDSIVIRRQGTNGLLVTSLIDGQSESKVYFRPGGFTAIRINLHDGDDRVSIDPSLSLPVHVVGGLGNDTITTARGNDVVYGDGIDGSGDDDHHGSGDGHDTIITGAGNDTVHAGNGNNYVDVGTGNNSVLGGSGVDQVRAGNGNNDIRVGDGDNNVRVGPGRNTIVVGNGANSISTGAGVDTIVVGDGANFIQAGNGRNTITAGNGANSISTGSGADVIRAGNGRNWVSSGAGNDRVVLGDGGNYVLAGDGADVVVTGAGSDSIFGGRGTDLILTGAGNDSVQGGLGNDVLVGGQGSDYVAGEAGRDLLFAGAVDLLVPVSDPVASLDQLLNQLRLLQLAWNPARGPLPTARPSLSSFGLVQVVEPTPTFDQILGGAQADLLWSDDALDQPIQ